MSQIQQKRKPKISPKDSFLTDASINAIISEIRLTPVNSCNRMHQLEYAVTKIILDSTKPADGWCDCSKRDALTVSKNVTKKLRSILS